MKDLLEVILPKDIDTSDHFWSSMWQNCEQEVIARNIVLNAQKANKWQPFTFNQYKQACSHKVTESENGVLEGFVKEGILAKKEGDYFVVKSDFIKAIVQFILES